ADARVAQARVHGEDRPRQLADRPRVEARRLDPARDRAEGPARDAAPDGALLRADRQRRQARAPPPRRGRRGGRRHPPRARAHRAHLPASGPPARRPRPDLPRGGAGWALAGDALEQRHRDRCLRDLPDPGRGEDRHRAEEPEHRPARPVVVVRLRAGRRLRVAATRRLRADRERRLPRRRGRARGAAGVQGVLQGPADLERRRDAAVIEAVNTRARGLRPYRAEAVGAASALRRLDWWLLGATAALLAFGLWAIAGI